MARIRDTYQGIPSGWRVTDPVTGVMFESNSYRNLRGKIITHRRNNNIADLNVDDFIHEQICARNPEQFCQDWPGLVRSRSIQHASNLWAELHRHALSHPEGTDWAWYNAWTDRIPKVGCSCRDNWRAWVSKNPPDFSNYFAWSVKAHNHVNRKLGKPDVSEELARRLWNSPAS